MRSRTPDPDPNPNPNPNLSPHPNQASACKAALNMPRSGDGKGGKGMEDDMDATKTGEAFDPRTLDPKARDTCTRYTYAYARPQGARWMVHAHRLLGVKM